MARVDFLISNDRHHRAMTWPVLAALENDRLRLRVLSLCEVRGLRSPTAAPRGVEIQRVVPFHLRRSPAVGSPPGRGSGGIARRTLRGLSWSGLIGPRLSALLADAPDLAVLPNDAAFPFDRIAALLRRDGIPFLLLQEGIRFPLPAASGGALYGAGGAAGVAAWGPASRDYFGQVGVPAERIHLTGSPRHDRLRPTLDRQQADRARAELRLPPRTLAFISNPIDDQGFCSHQAKMELFDRFLAGIEPLFAAADFHLAVKPHARESPLEFQQRIPADLGGRVSVCADVPLERLLRACRAAIVWASTVGLEALLCGLPLAVLEIPGHGFQYDYVESGIATGLSWTDPMAPQVASLMEPPEERLDRVDAYLQRQFAARGEAAGRVAEVIRSLLRRQR